jgi:hypothetical protein
MLAYQVYVHFKGDTGHIRATHFEMAANRIIHEEAVPEGFQIRGTAKFSKLDCCSVDLVLTTTHGGKPNLEQLKKHLSEYLHLGETQLDVFGEIQLKPATVLPFPSMAA